MDIAEIKNKIAAGEKALALPGFDPKFKKPMEDKLAGLRADLANLIAAEKAVVKAEEKPAEVVIVEKQVEAVKKRIAKAPKATKPKLATILKQHEKKLETVKVKATAKVKTAKAKVVSIEKKATKTASSLTDIVNRSKSLRGKYSGTSESSLKHDAAVKAKHPGKRISDTGHTYYESRSNRSDIHTNRAPYLERGGNVPNGPAEQPAHFGSGYNLDVLGFKTRNFDISGKIADYFAVFLKSIANENDDQDGYTLSMRDSLKLCAENLDNLFWIEKKVVSGVITVTPELMGNVAGYIEWFSIYNRKSGLHIEITDILGDHLYTMMKGKTGHGKKFARGGEIESSKYPGQYTIGEDDGEKPMFRKEELILLDNGWVIEYEYNASRMTKTEAEKALKNVKKRHGSGMLFFNDNEYGGHWRIWRKGKFESGGQLGEDDDEEFDQEESEEFEPNYEEDAFVTDKPNGGVDLSISGKFIGHYEDEDVYLKIREWQEQNNYYPNIIWHVSDHGNLMLMNSDGDEVKYEKGGQISERQVLDAAKQYNSELFGRVLGYESTWNKGQNAYEGNPVIYFSYFDDTFNNKFMIASGVLVDGKIINASDAWDAVYEHEIDALKDAKQFAENQNYGTDESFAKGGEVKVKRGKGDVYLGLYRKKIVVLDKDTNTLWANEYFKDENEALQFCQDNYLTLSGNEIVQWNKKETRDGRPLFDAPSFESGGKIGDFDKKYDIEYVGDNEIFVWKVNKKNPMTEASFSASNDGDGWDAYSNEDNKEIGNFETAEAAIQAIKEYSVTRKGIRDQANDNERFAKGGPVKPKLTKEERVTLMKAAMILAAGKSKYKDFQVGHTHPTEIIANFKTDPKDSGNINMAILYIQSYRDKYVTDEKQKASMDRVIQELKSMDGRKHEDGGEIKGGDIRDLMINANAVDDIYPAITRELIKKKYLSDNPTSIGFSSGGGFEHLAIKRTDGRWLLYSANETGITLSDQPYDTADEFYDAFWELDDVGTTFIMIDESDYSKKRSIKAIVKDVVDGNWRKLYESGGKIEEYKKPSKADSEKTIKIKVEKSFFNIENTNAYTAAQLSITRTVERDYIGNKSAAETKQFVKSELRKRIEFSGNNTPENKEKILDMLTLDLTAKAIGRDGIFKAGGRIKSAINRDRKYQSEQEWEKSYHRKTDPKHPKYKKRKK